MTRFFRTVLATVVVLSGSCVARAVEAPRDAAFWRAIVEAKFAVPAGREADALAWELTGFLATEEAELRDGFGFEITSAWLRSGRISPAMRGRLFERWREGMRREGTGNAAVLERAFSALNLSVLVAADNREPALGAAQVRAVLDEGLAALARETDRRGYDARLGWVHAAAHQADLLKFLARSRHCGAEDLRRILEAIVVRTEASEQPWIWGEEERFAAVVLSVARRSEVDATELVRVVSRLAKLPGGYAGARVDVPVYHRARNAAALLRVLHLSLAAGGGPRDGELAAAVLAALKS